MSETQSPLAQALPSGRISHHWAATLLDNQWAALWSFCIWRCDAQSDGVPVANQRLCFDCLRCNWLSRIENWGKPF